MEQFVVANRLCNLLRVNVSLRHDVPETIVWCSGVFCHLFRWRESVRMSKRSGRSRWRLSPSVFKHSILRSPRHFSARFSNYETTWAPCLTILSAFNKRSGQAQYLSKIYLLSETNLFRLSPLFLIFDFFFSNSSAPLHWDQYRSHLRRKCERLQKFQGASASHSLSLSLSHTHTHTHTHTRARACMHSLSISLSEKFQGISILHSSSSLSLSVSLSLSHTHSLQKSFKELLSFTHSFSFSLLLLLFFFFFFFFFLRWHYCVNSTNSSKLKPNRIIATRSTGFSRVIRQNWHRLTSRVWNKWKTLKHRYAWGSTICIMTSRHVR